jgi:hypothetical protein
MARSPLPVAHYSFLSLQRLKQVLRISLLQVLVLGRNGPHYPVSHFMDVPVNIGPSLHHNSPMSTPHVDLLFSFHDDSTMPHNNNSP